MQTRDAPYSASREQEIVSNRYPIDHPGSGEYADCIESCRSLLAGSGVCELPNFLTLEATLRAAREVATVAPLAHRSAQAMTAYLEPAVSADPAHPRARPMRSSHSALAFDVLRPDHLLRRLYTNDRLVEFFAAVLGVDRLYRYSDRLGALNAAIMYAGDEVCWHFDQTDFVVSIALQKSEVGGEFEYVPALRRVGDENDDGVARVLDGDRTGVRQIEFTPGTLLLFYGRNSLHRVTPVAGGTPRIVALMGFDTEPGTRGSDYLQQHRYGRTAS